MTSSGTYTYGPNLADIMDECMDNAGVDASTVGSSHRKSFTRSLRTMLNSEWATIGIRNWMVEEISQSMSVGLDHFDLPAGSIDIVEAVLRRPGGSIATNSDTEMYGISRNEYLVIVNKADQGRPDRYWVQRGDTMTAWIWQCGSNTTDSMVYNVFRQNQDVTGELTDTLGIPTIAYDALIAGMSARTALKWNPARFQLLQQLYLGPNMDPINPMGKLGALRNEDRDRGDFDLYAVLEPRIGRL
jgi:hypothetical protein